MHVTKSWTLYPFLILIHGRIYYVLLHYMDCSLGGCIVSVISIHITHIGPPRHTPQNIYWPNAVTLSTAIVMYFQLSIASVSGPAAKCVIILTVFYSYTLPYSSMQSQHDEWIWLIPPTHAVQVSVEPNPFVVEGNTSVQVCATLLSTIDTDATATLRTQDVTATGMMLSKCSLLLNITNC